LSAIEKKHRLASDQPVNRGRRLLDTVVSVMSERKCCGRGTVSNLIASDAGRPLSDIMSKLTTGITQMKVGADRPCRARRCREHRADHA
jgi:hypothetical protein